MRSDVFTAALAALALAACSEAPPESVAGPSFGPPGAGDPRATFAYPTDDAGLKIRSDHRFLSPDGSASVYDDGVCGAEAKIYAGGSGDATMDPDAGYTGAVRRSCSSARTITIFFDQPADGSAPPVNAVVAGGYFHVFNELWQMSIGVEVEGQGGFNVGRCNVLRFKPDPGRNGIAYPGSDKLLVMRLDASTWQVRTKPFPDNKAWCDSEQRLYHLPFQLTVRAK